MRMGHYTVAASLLLWALAPARIWAEDVVATQSKEFRGQVLSVDKNGIRIALAGGGETVIPRALVIGAPKVAPPPSVLRGIEAFEKGDLKNARLNLSKTALQYQGLDAEWALKAILYYGRACLAAGEYDKAETTFNVFMEFYGEAPLAIAAQIGQAQIEMAQKNYEPALAKLRELAEGFDQQLKPAKEQLPFAAEIYLDIGQCLENQTREPEALDAYLKLIALYPAAAFYPEALYRAARLYAKQNQPQKADALYAELIEDYASHELAKKAVPERAALPRAAATGASAAP